MARETEIKLRIENRKGLLGALKRLGAKPKDTKRARLHESNLIFDTPDGGLAKHGQLLRIRTETTADGKRPRKGRGQARTVLTFKSPPEELAIGNVTPSGDRRHKVREEIETELIEGDTLRRIFEGLGLRGWFRYEKYRTTYVLPGRLAWAKGLLIELDETPIGTFVELEGPAEAIDRAARELGYSPKDYVLKNYLVLYLDECKRTGKQPTHMEFGEK
ncbi:MAG TPA: class IV adenylate cyclase [Candidatus Acidoferrum sp.]|nr:class IV adenylate cyclase [Candidatus Acidoferrum sp.]